MLGICQKIADAKLAELKAKLPESKWRYEDGEASLDNETYGDLNRQRTQAYIDELEKAVVMLEEQLRKTEQLLKVTQRVLNPSDQDD
jgi:hypothetical protein